MFSDYDYSYVLFRESSFDTLLSYWMTSQNVVRRVGVGHVLRADQKWLHQLHQLPAKLTVPVLVLLSTCQSRNKIVFMESKDYGLWSAVTYYEMSAAAVTARISSKQFPAVSKCCVCCVYKNIMEKGRKENIRRIAVNIYSPPRACYFHYPLSCSVQHSDLGTNIWTKIDGFNFPPAYF